jgi:transcriptional regulator with GAF, ATPase, and Fis domain
MTSDALPLARAAAALVTEHDVTDVLAHLLADGQHAVGATAAGLLVRSVGGELEVLTATSHRASELEAYQAQQEAGPCADAITTGHPVFQSGSERLAERWPDLAPMFADAAYSAVQAHPLRWHGQVLGAINFFHADPRSETEELLSVGQAFADMATLILLTPHEISRSDIATRTRQALVARTVVEQAKGVLAYQRGVDVEQAYDLLLERVRVDGVSLSATAADIVRHASRTV